MKQITWADMPNLKKGQKLWYQYSTKFGVIKGVVEVTGRVIEFSVPVNVLKIVEQTGIYSNVQLGFRYLTTKDLYFIDEVETNG